MNSTVDFSQQRMPRLNEIEKDLKAWEEVISDWAKRIPWATPDQREKAMFTAKFLRKLVAECWIHTIAAQSRGGDPMDSAAFRARRVYRQLLEFWPKLAKNMEERLPETVPNIAA
ncbi:MAG: hypothetical protein P9L92_09355 [Candidatus Electryonea clarkiae]|nr:hypothetical protein [Candidatus Electryonea clarkiae]MDP8288143.1 hypothetical protein [Candidatus Electryonea clarkiae]